MLRVAANTVGPLALNLREGPIISRPGTTDNGGLVSCITMFDLICLIGQEIFELMESSNEMIY